MTLYLVVSLDQRPSITQPYATFIRLRIVGSDLIESLPEHTLGPLVVLLVGALTPS